MTEKHKPASKDWLSKIDFEAIPDRDDKLAECQYFLSLAELEADRQKFRWLISAFLNAVYSFFETSALYAHVAFTSPDTGEPIADTDALETLKQYVEMSQRQKDPYYVKTAGKHEITKRLYKVRQSSTHHYALRIMATGPSLPEDFHFGSERGNGTPVLTLCRDAMNLILKVNSELGNI